MVCDKNCFSCTYADCIYDGLDYDDYKAERELDLISGAKELAGSPKARAAQRKYYEENREKVAAAQRKYYEENREKVAAAQRKYREENREKVNADSRSYYQKNKEKWAKYRQNRKAKLQGGNANG